MDTERNLLFGVVAFQNGAVDADRLAETCADWVSEPTVPLADLLVDRGLMTEEQRTEVEKVVAQELATHGDDPEATLAATLDGQTRAAISSNGELVAKLNVGQAQGGHVVLGTLSPGEVESRERYTLTHLHAKGGMGRVWLARDGALGRQIALKELRPDQADNSVVCSRFLYEAKITAQLEHPGIVPVYELGEGQTPYYTMRFVRGHTLSEAIRAYHKKRAAGQANSVGMVELLTAFVGVCHAVAYAHSRGIIHRDLKGQNVVLGDFGEVIVLDWGLAKRVGPDQVQSEGDRSGQEAAAAPMASEAATHAGDAFTLPEGHDPLAGPVSNARAGAGADASANGSASHRSNPSSGSGRRIDRESGAGPAGTMQGQLLGTPAYMAPEQAKGHHDRVDQRTDIYGLGAILYEILTGRPPFIGPKTAEILRKVCQEAPTPPRQIVTEIAPGLEAVCLKALRKEQGERYGSAADLAHEVQRWMADEPVHAYVEPWARRALRWTRRHKTSVSAAAGLLVAATIALAVSTVLISRERDEAETQGHEARQAVQLLTKVKDVGFEDQLDPIQQEFLEDALNYYQRFTGRVAGNPKVALEHGLVSQQMGDLQRMLGRLPESEKAYRNAIKILDPLASGANAEREPKRALARTRTLLADLLVRRGSDTGQAEPLYHQAAEMQQALANPKDDATTPEDRLSLGQTLKSQADLMRLNGQFAPAKPVYDQALAVLERAHAANPQHAEIRNQLAMAVDARGWIHRELGDLNPAEQDYRRAVELLDALVAEFPTVSRHREALAKACNSLGLIEESTGRLADAETHLRRELPLVERLAQDFPKRPEHRRELARTLTNLSNVLLAQNRTREAEPILHRAVEVTGAIAVKHPDDVQIRLDLAKDHSNLGELLREKGDPKSAIVSYLKAQSIIERLVKEFPDKPRYRDVLAYTLVNLALAREAAGQPDVAETYRAARALYEKLVADYPDNIDYPIGEARCLLNMGPVVADAGRPDQAEALYRQALALLETKDAGARTPERLRTQADVLNNLGDLERKLNQPGAEKTLRRAVGLFDDLAARKPSVRKDRHNLAIAQYNLGEVLAQLKRLPEAGTLFTQAATRFEALVAEAPESIDFQSQLGLVLEKQGILLAESGKPAEAKAALENAIAHQRRSVQLSRHRDDTRALLGSHLVELAGINLKLGAYDEAARNALDVLQAVPVSDRAEGCLDAARILARLVSQAGADGQLAASERDRLTRNYLGRTILLVREAIDASPKLADPIKKDPDIKRLESRPEFQTILNTLVNLGR